MITSMARTMLLHAMKHWPDIVDATFWTFAIKQAILIHNITPRHGMRESPYELFTNEDPPIQPQDLSVFGCPTYTLDKKLQESKTIPKFTSDRSHLGVYVRQSPDHVSNVAMIYNPTTEKCSNQYHLIFDEAF